MKKIIGIMLLCMMILPLCFAFAACGSMYSGHPATKAEMSGTYKLTLYVGKDDANQEVDKIEPNGIEAYLVVNENGTGYYAYKDSKTALTVEAITISFVQDDEETSKFKAINTNAGRGNVMYYQKAPGCGDEPPMGFSVKNKTFSYTIIKSDAKPKLGVKAVPYSRVVYTQVSKETTLESLAARLSIPTPVVPRFELKNALGPHTLACSTGSTNEGLFKYFVIDVKADETIDVYYQKVGEDPVASIGYSGATLEFIAPTAQDAPCVVANLKIDVLGADRAYRLNTNSYCTPSGSFYYVDESDYANEFFNQYISFDAEKTINDIIQEEISKFEQGQN